MTVRLCAHCLVMADKTPDDFLFKHAPREVKELNLRARKENRARKREQWAAANPNNWRVKGKQT